MRKYISILFVVGLLSCFMPEPCLAQDEITEYVADELKGFYKELDKEMDTQLAMFLKRKEVDPESGKKKIVEYNTVLTEL